MIVCKKISELRKLVSQARMEGRRIGLVPTMGNLHAAHASLVSASADDGNFTVVSIFVNPTQFGPGEDFQSYPRTPDQDVALCRYCRADVVFMPEADELYPGERFTSISVAKITERLCGASRPGHFDGVCVVVSKLFNIVLPDAAYFGRKDAQQLAVIRQMVADLDFPIDIVACDLVREADGLAMSSRNAYLTPEQRSEALALSGSLELAVSMVADGHRDVKKMISTVQDYLSEHASSGKIDYIELVDPDTILPVTELLSGRDVLLAVAVKFTTARLIDNMIIRV